MYGRGGEGVTCVHMYGRGGEGGHMCTHVRQGVMLRGADPCIGELHTDRFSSSMQAKMESWWNSSIIAISYKGEGGGGGGGGVWGKRKENGVGRG